MQDQPQNLRGLKALVGGLGVLIVVGTTIVIGTIIHRLYASAPPPPMVNAAVMALPPAAARLQPGEHVAGIAAAGADVVIWVTGPAGDKVLLLDPASGQMRVGLQGMAGAQK